MPVMSRGILDGLASLPIRLPIDVQRLEGWRTWQSTCGLSRNADPWRGSGSIATGLRT